LAFDGVDSTSLLKWWKIEWGNVGIVCDEASPRISNNVIRVVDDTGVLVNNGSSPRVEGNYICSYAFGVRCELFSNPVIVNNLITNDSMTNDQTVGISGHDRKIFLDFLLLKF
jgi:hypothetical protein